MDTENPVTCILRFGPCNCGCGGSVTPCPRKVQRVVRNIVEFQGPVPVGTSMTRALGMITLNGGTAMVKKMEYALETQGSYRLLVDDVWTKAAYYQYMGIF